METYSRAQIEHFFRELSEESEGGPLSDRAVEKAMLDGDIFIYPFSKRSLTPIGYNFCPSEIIISTRTGLPLAIHEKNGEKYVTVGPNETVLVSTREYISVSDRLMGTFHSKVKMVSAGFGHISTTMDPGWKGPLLIALNNPNSHKLKLTISEKGSPKAFVTLVFSRFSTMNSQQRDSHPPYRTDVFDTYVARASHLKRIFLGRAFTDYEQMVRMIHDSMDIRHAYIEKSPLLKELETCIVNLKNVMIAEGETGVDEQIAFEDFFRCRLKLTAYEEISEDLKKMLSYLSGGICEFIQQRDRQQFSWFEEKYAACLDICYARIQKEAIGQFWQKKYEEIREISVAHNYRWRWGIGIRWRAMALKGLVLAVLVGLAVLGSRQEEWEFMQYVWAPLVSGVFGALILNWLKKST